MLRQLGVLPESADA